MSGDGWDVGAEKVFLGVNVFELTQCPRPFPFIVMSGDPGDLPVRSKA